MGDDLVKTLNPVFWMILEHFLKSEKAAENRQKAKDAISVALGYMFYIFLTALS